MSVNNIMQQALAKQWLALPGTLKAHYNDKANTDIGMLTIEYPVWMQLFLNVLHMMGALLNRKGNQIQASVVKEMKGNVQHWSRTITFDDGKKVYFKSHWTYAGNNKLIEYVNPVLGLCMSVEVMDNVLHYHGEYYVIKLGKLMLRVPEWLLLGHTTIEEKEVDSGHFMMDFRLQHPLFGQIYRYSGKFTTVVN